MNPQNCNAHILAERVKQYSLDLFCEHKYKLFFQSYDGVLMIKGQYGRLQTLVRKEYTCANFAHCYAHQLILISTMQRVKIKRLEYFASVAQFVSYFFFSSHRIQTAGSSARCNFYSRTVPTVYNTQTFTAYMF